MKRKWTDAWSTYGFWGSVRLVRDLLLTALYGGKARIIRRPVYIRGKRHISWGKGFTTGVGLRMDAMPVVAQGRLISIGDNVQVNDYVHIAACASVVIGNNVLIASKVFITDHNHGSYSGDGQDAPFSIPEQRRLSFAPVRIEDNVWIGEFVTVLPGVTIGKGSVIGAMTLVNRDVPPFSMVVGIPAKVVKQYNQEKNEWERV